jgi:hypothetical protein
VYAIDSQDTNGNPIIRVKFHGDNSLENVAAGAGSTFFPLGIPKYRFGHDYVTGQPREFVDDTNGQPTVLIGRFIHEETSHRTFTYPYDLANGNPLARDPNQAGYVSPMTDDNAGSPNAVVDRYEGGTRRSEDILMTHVHGFDVKVWDDLAGGWRDIGWADAPQANPPVIGDYSASRNQHRFSPNPPYPQIVYGPRDQAQVQGNRVFDTWHPGLDINNSDPPADPRPDGFDRPPYRAMRPGPDGVAGNPGDDDGDGTDDEPDELGWPGSDDVPLPMRALRVTVRYYDVSSDQNRTLTLEFSLLD